MHFEYSEKLFTVLGRSIGSSDAVEPERIRGAEKRLGVVLPEAVASFYREAGAAREFQEHDTLLSLEALEVEEGFIVFMKENQNVVHWGIRMPPAEVTDPEVWQRVNGSRPAWHPEEMTFSEFVVVRVAFTRGWRKRD
jgi:hypothetical protein